METKTEKGHPCVIFQSNKFRLNHEGKRRRTWRCTTRYCNAMVHSLPGTSDIIENTVVHKHEDNVLDIQKHVFRVQCKDKGKENLSCKPESVVCQQLSKLGDTASILRQDVVNAKRAMYNAKRKEFPPFPKSTEESIMRVQEINMCTSKGEQFLLYSANGLIIYSCKTNLRYLCSATVTLGDGTFFVTPKFFYQVYTLHGYIKDTHVPLVMCLLSDKSAVTYRQMLQVIVDKCTEFGLQWLPNLVLLDFETAAHKAFSEIFPGIEIRCCRFHFGQAILRKIRELGLSNEYRNPESRVGYWLKHIYGLAFLPPETVYDTYASTLLPAVNLLPELEPFSKYFVETYASNTARYPPPTLWARLPTDYGLDTPSTTNGCENYHKHLKDHFGTSHPNLYKFSTVLLERQELTYVRLQSLSAAKRPGPTDRQKDIAEKCQLYIDGQLTPFLFVQKLSFKYLPAEV